MSAYLRVLALAVAFAFANAQPYFVVYEADSADPRRSDILTDGFVFCPSSFAPSITLECVAPEDSYATMYINGVYTRRESSKPFIVSGDVNGFANAWTYPSGEVELTCETASSSVTITGEFECASPTTTPSTSSAPSPNESKASRRRKKRKARDDDIIVGEVEPVIITDGAPEVTVMPVVATEPGDMVEAEVEELAPTDVPEIDEEAVLDFNWNYCVGLPAQNHTNRRPKLWEPNGTALVYDPTNDCAHCIYKPNKAVLKYNFSVTVASRYAITMESETKDKTEHNDGWIGFEPGITLVHIDPDTNKTSEIPGLVEPQKAYHNTAMRYEGAFSVDGIGFSFSTTDVLVPGVNYTITFGARSTQFKFYGLILFPCSGDNCYHHTDYFLRYLQICSVSS